MLMSTENVNEYFLEHFVENTSFIFQVTYGVLENIASSNFFSQD